MTLEQQLSLAQAEIQALQNELYETNRGLLALNLELEQRVDARTDELRDNYAELKRTNSEMMQLTIELEERVATRTEELVKLNDVLTAENIERQRAVEELGRYKNHLEEQVQQRTAELIAACAAAEAASQTVQCQLSELEASELKFRNLLEKLPISVIMLDDNGTIFFRNQRFLDWFGYTEADCPSIEQWWLLAYPDAEYRQYVSKVWNESLRQATEEQRDISNQEYKVTSKDGRVRDIEFTGFAADNIQLNIHIDHTEYRRLQDELLHAKETAEAANHAKSVFLANMSHELRTPINAILGFSDILKRDPNITEKQLETLSIIHKSGDHLLGLINDVLEISKIEAGRTVLQTKPFDLSSLILDVTDMLRICAQSKGLQLLIDQSSEFPRYIVSDEAKLRQILINLLTNAIKATEQGGVSLHLGVKHDHTEHLIIEVEDTGCGISALDQSQLFQSFVQVGMQGKQQGTGLGLSITRQFAKLMGGDISVTSTVGQGSIFRVELLIEIARSEDVQQSVAERGDIIGIESGQLPCRVLVVEDQLDNQILLIRPLLSVGFEVKLAENGAIAVEQFEHWQPHFIWMDRRMPIMDGVEATRRIRALPNGEKVKIAAITASSFKEQDEELTTAGFDAIVHKPYRVAQIFDCMESLLGLRFTRASLKESSVLPVELSHAELAALPQALRDELKTALISLEKKRISQVVEKVSAYNPPLQQTLSQLTKDFGYSTILKALKTGNE